MPQKNSLCLVNWKLGQPLMPGHFIRQEDSLRAGFEERLRHLALPTWGVAALAWNEALLAREGVFELQRLQWAPEAGGLIDIPGNAQPVSIQLPQVAEGPLDIFLERVDEPLELVNTESPDGEGGFIELARHKLKLSLRALDETGKGFRLARVVLVERDSEQGSERGGADSLRLAERGPGWRLDLSYVPPLITFAALRDFSAAFVSWANWALDRWGALLKHHVYDKGLAVDKRVEAQLYQRRVWELKWYFRQVMPIAGPLDPRGSRSWDGPALRAHPFSVYSRLVSFYLDVFAFRTSPAEFQFKQEPRAAVYRHDRLAECFAELQDEITALLERPPSEPGVRQFERSDSGCMICELPRLLVGDDIYFLVEFAEIGETPKENSRGIDVRIEGIRLANPERVEFMERRALPGVRLERAREVPFAHSFDMRVVQFYRVLPSDAWSEARSVRRIGYLPAKHGIKRAYMYWPKAAELEDAVPR